MYRSFLAAVITMAGLVAAGAPACAQDTSQPVTIVTYAEVAPAKSAEARKLVLAYAAAARKADGAVQVDVGQRISDPGHFGIVEQWKSLAAKQAFAVDRRATVLRQFQPVVGILHGVLEGVPFREIQS